MGSSQGKKESIYTLGKESVEWWKGDVGKTNNQNLETGRVVGGD